MYQKVNFFSSNKFVAVALKTQIEMLLQNSKIVAGLLKRMKQTLTSATIHCMT